MNITKHSTVANYLTYKVDKSGNELPETSRLWILLLFFWIINTN